MQAEQSQTTNASQPRDLGRKIVPTARQAAGAAGTTPKLRVSFRVKEAARLVGMPRTSLRDWVRNKWVPTGSDGTLSAWTVLALSILAATNRGRGTGSYLGDVPVRRAMESVADLDDALLLSEDVQDPYAAEAAAAIANAALPSAELSDEMVANVAKVVAAIDRKVMKTRNSPR